MLYGESIPDYIGSDYFLFLDQILKEHAESLLVYFFEECKEPFSLKNLEQGLNQLLNHNIPVSVKKKLPSLFRQFFEFVNSQGKLSEAESLFRDLEILETQFVTKVRENGSIKGSTYVKKYTDVGRNDSCPCGSGKKFKKCCMKLISG